MNPLINRRAARSSMAASLNCLALDAAGGADRATFQLSAFRAEVTVPIGHPLMGGGIARRERSKIHSSFMV